MDAIREFDRERAKRKRGRRGPAGPPGEAGPSGAVINPIQDAGTLTIATGVITLPVREGGTSKMVVKVDTEAAAATDDLTTITPGSGGLPTGFTLSLGTVAQARDVTALSVGNIRLSFDLGNFVLADPLASLVLEWTGTLWRELSRANNA